MPEINIMIKNKIATKSNNVTYICDNSDYVINFDFDDEWDAYDTKTARFAYGGQYTDIIFVGNRCNVPVITNTYAFHIGVFAGDLHTTTPVRVPCRKSILSSASIHVDPTPDVYDQLMELIKGLGGVAPDDIAKAVADYLTAHPIEETDPTVSEWAKAKTKPTYSAAEVGAISQDDLQAATNEVLAQAKASGEFDGANGAPGKDGTDGKTAYQYAVDGGYTGTEAEFASKLAQEKFANPNALTFTGAMTGSYDGSMAVSVEIPSAATDDHINSLIDAKLGVIENGSY
jgi:hypothetical protein